MDDPTLNQKRMPVPGRTTDRKNDLNSSADPPGGEDLSSYRGSFLDLKSSTARIPISAEDMQRIESKIFSIEEATLDDELEALINAGIVPPARRAEFRGLAREIKQAPQQQRANIMQRMKKDLLDASSKRFRVSSKTQKQDASVPPLEVLEYLRSLQQKKQAHPHQPPVLPEAARQHQGAENEVCAEKSEVVSAAESLQALADEKAREAKEEQAVLEARMQEEKTVINELYLETGEFVDGNFKDVNRNNKYLVKNEILQKKLAKTDVPEY